MEGFGQLEQLVFLLYHLSDLLHVPALLFVLIVFVVAMVLAIPPVGPPQFFRLQIFEGFEVEREHFLLSLYFLLDIFVDEGLEECHALVDRVLRFFVEPDLVELQLNEVHLLLLLLALQRLLLDRLDRSLDQRDHRFQGGRVLGSDIGPALLDHNVDELDVALVQLADQPRHVALNVLPTDTAVVVQQTHNGRIVFQSLEPFAVPQLQHLSLVLRLYIDSDVFLGECLENRGDEPVADGVVQCSQQGHVGGEDMEEWFFDHEVELGEQFCKDWDHH